MISSCDLAGSFERVRARSLALCKPLAIEDYGVQPIEDASPPKWHLAHTSWFFETFVLAVVDPGRAPIDPAYEHLFNSYYNGVGQPFPRALRGTLSRPTVSEVQSYRRAIDEEMLRWLPRLDADMAARIVLGLHHEQQHQELMLTDIKANLGRNPLLPAYDAELPTPSSARGEASRVAFDGGVVEVGHPGDGFCFDNELPRHRQFVEPFELASHPVSNAEFAAFIEDGGYRTASLWLSEAWDWLRRSGIDAPAYWLDDGAEYRLSGRGERIADAPVCHVSFFEADAFARWAGARLPSEAEWELAATQRDADTPVANVARDGAPLHPQACDSDGLSQLAGDVWEWTLSAYGPYPGYQTAEGALGEYNGKFMSSQRVLRGGSCATPQGHLRSTYRNFFYPADRWQFSGLRLAWDR